MRHILIPLILLLVASTLRSQHHSENGVHLSDHSHFRISASISHTYLPESTLNGKEFLALPSFGLDVEYWINHDWGLGLHNDLELLQFEIVDRDEIMIEREFPILLTLDALWKPVGGLVFFGGPGIELERTENYYVLRLGAEYEFAISPNWDMSPIAFYDLRKDAYNTFSVGLSIGFHTRQIH